MKRQQVIKLQSDSARHAGRMATQQEGTSIGAVRTHKIRLNIGSKRRPVDGLKPSIRTAKEAFRTVSKWRRLDGAVLNLSRPQSVLKSQPLKRGNTTCRLA
jgi:hypothetical protein